MGWPLEGKPKAEENTRTRLNTKINVNLGVQVIGSNDWQTVTKCFKAQQ